MKDKLSQSGGGLLKIIDRTSPEMVDARRRDLLEFLEMTVRTVNNSGDYRYLGVPNEIDAGKIDGLPNYRVLLRDKITALLANIKLPGDEDQSEEAELLFKLDSSMAELLGSIKAYDCLDAEIDRVNSTEEAA